MLYPPRTLAAECERFLLDRSRSYLIALSDEVRARLSHADQSCPDDHIPALGDWTSGALLLNYPRAGVIALSADR